MVGKKVRSLARRTVDVVPQQVKWRLMGYPPVSSVGASLFSVISPYQEQPEPPRDLVTLALDAARLALDVRFEPGGVLDRCNSEQRIRLNDWPGHHYRFLAALGDILNPGLVVEVGTFTGMSALALLDHTPAAGRVVTYDVVPWAEFGDRAVVEASDFGDRLEQRIGDLADPATFNRDRGLLSDADLFFVDGPKDGNFEQTFLPKLFELRSGGKPGLVVLDDVRVLNMVEFWHTLAAPKLDVTSLGHWSGTGLVQLGATA
jgi:predicted O-methyltransferase YrrM